MHAPLINPFVLKPYLLAEAGAPRTDKIIKNHLGVFERGGNLLQRGIHHFSIKSNQSPGFAFKG